MAMVESSESSTDTSDQSSDDEVMQVDDGAHIDVISPPDTCMTSNLAVVAQLHEKPATATVEAENAGVSFVAMAKGNAVQSRPAIHIPVNRTEEMEGWITFQLTKITTNRSSLRL